MTTSRVYLLDANILIASSSDDHASYNHANGWLARRRPRFATCPITQGALFRYHFRAQGGGSVDSVKEVLRRIVDRPEHVFWPDDVSYLALPERGLRGHKQVTDFYLAALAGKNGGKLATMDKALAASFPDLCELI